ncbi:MAG: hypothetical protein K8U03_05160 [Planctomycetia bacterium]|nr:hypothetical protein [Planctomycetia bacterium]
MRKTSLILVFSLFAISWATSAPVRGDLSETSEARYLAGLRERRLFSLVEAYCRRRLGEAYLIERRRAELTVELSRTALEAALFAKSPEREELAARALKIVDDELRNKPSSAWRPLLDVQHGLVDLVWGERLREEAQLLDVGEPQLEQARARLRTAVMQLKQARTTLEERLRELNRTRPSNVDSPLNSDVPDADDWASLRRNVDYQLGRAYRNQGESYPPRSADRASSLELAIETFESLTRAESTDSITWQARLEEVTCKRLLGDLMAAERVLDLVDAQAPPADVADRARAQRIRVRILAGRLDEARKFLRPEDTDAASNADADVRLAALEWLIASTVAEEKAGRTSEATEVRARAGALTRLIAERQAPYWARRAEALAASAVATSPAGHGDSSLAVAAASFYRQGNLDKAIEIYDQLFTQAWSKRQQELAFDAAFTAGAIEQGRKRHEAAAERFAKLSQTLADHPRSAEAQLLASYNLGQTLLATQANPDLLQAGLARYAQSLETQIRQWPNAKETAQARVWLGRLRTQQRAWDAAAQAFGAVGLDASLALEAVQGLIYCRSAQLAALRAAAQPTEPAFSVIEIELSRYVPGYPDRIASPMPPASRAAAISLAKLGLLYGKQDFASGSSATHALSLITAVAGEPELPAEERSTIEVWMIAALSATHRLDDALKRAVQLKTANPRDASAVVQLLDAMPTASDGINLVRAQTVMRLIGLLPSQRELLNATERLPVDRAEARALDLLGPAGETRRAYDALARNYPQDGDAQLAYAEFLSKQTDRESLTIAAAKWREIERASSESSPRWYRARLGMAEAYDKLGDRARAKQLIELTQALHPELGGPTLKPKYDALLMRLNTTK